MSCSGFKGRKGSFEGVLRRGLLEGTHTSQKNSRLVAISTPYFSLARKRGTFETGTFENLRKVPRGPPHRKRKGRKKAGPLLQKVVICQPSEQCASLCTLKLKVLVYKVPAFASLPTSTDFETILVAISLALCGFNQRDKSIHQRCAQL